MLKARYIDLGQKITVLLMGDVPRIATIDISDLNAELDRRLREAQPEADHPSYPWTFEKLQRRAMTT